MAEPEPLSQEALEDLALEEVLMDYLNVALANGFSKGTANVSPEDMKKLMPLLRHYSRKPHPFTSCVRDNRKRFGPATEKYCAVIKDLIYGSTRWRRGGDKKIQPRLSEMTKEDFEHWYLDAPSDFYQWLSEITEEEIQGIISESEKQVEFIASLSKKGETETEEADMASEETVALSEFVEEGRPIAELYFEDGEIDEVEGLIWKTVLREGTWKYSPGAGQQPTPKPITVVADGQSDAAKLVISMSELLQNFNDGAVEHVTVPTSHADKVLENTGFVRKLRIAEDEQGRKVLQAGIDFTEPEVKDKALRGTIANTSAGILFDYITKEAGKKFRAVLAHVALTNHPWLNGMKPFGINASDEPLVALNFAEDVDNEEIDLAEETVSQQDEVRDTTQGGDNRMSEQENSLLTELGLSEDEIRARLVELSELKAAERKRSIEDRCKVWQEEGKAPAVVAEARTLMMADEGATALMLSEDGTDKTLTVTEVVERLMEKIPNVDLSEDQTNEQNASEGNEPENDATRENEVALSAQEKRLAAVLHLEEGMSEEDAIAEAKRRIAEGK